MSIVDNSLLVHDMGVLRQTEKVEQKRVGTTINEFGGSKLDYTNPQPRFEGTERPPELKTISARAPSVVRGETYELRKESGLDPQTPLGKLWRTVSRQHMENRPLFNSCNQSLKEIRQGYTLINSPPEYDVGGHAQALKDQAEKLRYLAQQCFSSGQGAGIQIGDTGVELGPRMKEMLLQAASELEELGNYLEDMPDPRPTMKDVGHFKSFETLGAMNVLDEKIEEKKGQIDTLLQGIPGGTNWENLLKTDDTDLQDELGGEVDQEVIDQLKTHRDGLQLLVDTRVQLGERHDILTGNTDDDTFKGEQPMSKSKLTKALGKEKPNILDKLFGKLGLTAFGRAQKDMTETIRNGGMPPLSNPKMSEAKMMTTLLQERLKQAGMGDISGDEISDQLEHEHVQALSNQQTWDKIEKEVKLSINGETKNFTSTLTPHSKLTGKPEELEDGKGVCCHDAKNEISSNVWQSELKDDRGEVMFRQMRTGVNCAYEIEDDVKRKEVNEGRARQMLTLHVHSDPRVGEQIDDGKDPIVIKNLWVSHLTPDGFRSGVEDELKMSREQSDAMKSLAGVHTFTVMHNGEPREIRVKYEPIMFSMGVNFGAVGLLSDLSLGRSGNWDTANREFNNDSMTQLLGDGFLSGTDEPGGWVGEGLKNNRDLIAKSEKEIVDILRNLGGNQPVPGSQQELRMQELEQTTRDARASNERIEVLARQVRQIWTSGEYKTQTEDPYKMSSRLGVLGYEIGCSITSNCKSNKDRNSYGDVHMKDLSIQMHEKGEIRGPNQPRSREEQLNLRTLSRQSGNSELQRYNVGGAGYKLEKVGMVYYEQGLQYHDDSFLGFGKFTAT